MSDFFNPAENIFFIQKNMDLKMILKTATYIVFKIINIHIIFNIISVQFLYPIFFPTIYTLDDIKGETLNKHSVYEILRFLFYVNIKRIEHLFRSYNRYICLNLK